MVKAMDGNPVNQPANGHRLSDKMYRAFHGGLKQEHKDLNANSATNEHSTEDSAKKQRCSYADVLKMGTQKSVDKNPQQLELLHNHHRNGEMQPHPGTSIPQPSTRPGQKPQRFDPFDPAYGVLDYSPEMIEAAMKIVAIQLCPEPVAARNNLNAPGVMQPVHNKPQQLPHCPSSYRPEEPPFHPQTQWSHQQRCSYNEQQVQQCPNNEQQPMHNPTPFRTLAEIPQGPLMFLDPRWSIDDPANPKPNDGWPMQQRVQQRQGPRIIEQQQWNNNVPMNQPPMPQQQFAEQQQFAQQQQFAPQVISQMEVNYRPPPMQYAQMCPPLQNAQTIQATPMRLLVPVLTQPTQPTMPKITTNYGPQPYMQQPNFMHVIVTPFNPVN